MYTVKTTEPNITLITLIFITTFNNVYSLKKHEVLNKNPQDHQKYTMTSYNLGSGSGILFITALAGAPLDFSIAIK